MNDRHLSVAVGVALAVALVWWQQRAAATMSAGGDAGASTPASGASPDILTSIGDAVNGAVSSLTPYAVALMLPGNAGYVDYLSAVEVGANLPAGLLVRLAFQECRFRADIIEGRTTSPAGAVGMFQLMPATSAGQVDSLDWRAAAHFAANMLNRLYARFGTWAMALAAYNWGEGNLSRKGIAAAPTETRNYYNNILADIGQPVTFA